MTLEWIGGASQALAGVASSVSNAVIAKKTRKWQTSEREASQKWQDEQTKRNIEYQKQKEAYDYEHYNSPYARMQALREAGLNPDLAYGQGASSGMEQSSISSPGEVSAPGASLPDVSSGFNQIGQGINNAVRSKHELDNIDADTDLKKKKGEESESIALLNGSKIRLTDSQARWNEQDIERISTQIKNLDADTNLANARIGEVLANKAFLKASAQEKKQAVYEASRTFQTRFQLLKEQFREEVARAGITEKQLDYIARTLEANIEKAFAERDSAKSQSVLDYWNGIDADYSHQNVYEFKDKDGNVVMSGTGARILMDTMVAMASGQTQLLEKQLDLLRTYGSAHAIMSLASEFVSALGSAAASIMAMKFMTGKNAGASFKASPILLDTPYNGSGYNGPMR